MCTLYPCSSLTAGGYILGAAFLIAMILLSKVPFSFMVRGLKAIVVLLLITMIFNVLLTPGNVLWQWGILRVTTEGLVLAGKMGIRLVFLILGASLMTLTTTPTKLTDALEKLYAASEENPCAGP